MWRTQLKNCNCPCFKSAAIGCLHEASEAFLVSKCPFIPVKKKFSNYRLNLIRTVKQIIIADNLKFLDMSHFAYVCKTKGENGISYLISEMA